MLETQAGKTPRMSGLEELLDMSSPRVANSDAHRGQAGDHAMSIISGISQQRVAGL